MNDCMMLSVLGSKSLRKALEALASGLPTNFVWVALHSVTFGSTTPAGSAFDHSSKNDSQYVGSPRQANGYGDPCYDLSSRYPAIGVMVQ